MDNQGFALLDKRTGVIALASVRHSAASVRQYAIETEREYMLELENVDATDDFIWRRCRREGWKVVPIQVVAFSKDGTGGAA